MATLTKSPKINLRTMFFLTCVTLIVFCSCALAHTDVTAEQARDLISSTKDLVVVDVREPYEYCDAAGHIPGALNYPLSSGVLEARFEELPKDGPVLVVCRSGGRSNQAANFLDSKGFSMVYDMMGGMSAWILETAPCKDEGDSVTADSAETNTYLFLSGQSTVVQTGGIAGVHETYPIQGQFQLKVDVNAKVAGFGYVDAFLLSPVSSSPPLSLGELFNMTTLVGAVPDDTTISFTGKADDGSDVLITVTIEDDLVYLVGETIPPPNSADFFMFSLDAVAQRKYSGGTGELNNPYQIATAEELMLLGETPEDYDKHFILTADIDLDPNLPGRKVFDKAVIAPDTNDVADDFQGTLFTGVFNGNNHTISHLRIKGTGYIGLFGQLGCPANVFDLGLEGVEVTGTECIGGLVGHNYGTISASYSTGTVNGGEAVGGLVGWNSSSITMGHSIGSVSGTWYVGGLVGYNAHSGNIKASYSISTVDGSTYVGGLAGLNEIRATIMNSYSKSTITGDSWVGGLAGYNGGPDWGGGGTGYISNSYSVSTISSAGEYVSGFVGENWGSIVSCFWSSDISGQFGGFSTLEMQTADTFLNAGWDLVGETENGSDDIWKIAEGLGYPRLSWEKYSGGTGEPNDPFQIATAEDLMLLGETPEDYDKHFILTADIDLDPNLPGRKVFDKAVIAQDSDPTLNEYGNQLYDGIAFTGMFDGNGHTISHLTITGNSYLALFGRFDFPAEVNNLGLVDVNIIGSGWYIGGIVGENGSWSYQNGGSVTNCYSNGVVSGNTCVGGLVGSNESYVIRCYSSGVVSGNSWAIGGLVGSNNYYGIITASYSTATVSGGSCVGGLAGCNSGCVRITNSYSTGVVTGDAYAGALVGENGGDNRCYSYIDNCYSIATVMGDSDYVGGLVGSNWDYGQYVTACFWDPQTSGQVTAEMQTAKTFLDAGWDFVGETENGTEDIWKISEGLDYPRLWWEPCKYSGGTGEPNDPYQIATAADLIALGETPEDYDKHFILTADIDLDPNLPGRKVFDKAVIGTFSSVFDGNGHIILHLTINGDSLLGLFGSLRSGAEVKNLGLMNASVNGSGYLIGGLAGMNGGTVTQCYIIGTVRGDHDVGGLVGENQVAMTQCFSIGMVRGGGTVGGLVGNNSGAVTLCSSSGEVTADRKFGGGLIGTNGGTVTQCSSDAEVNADDYVGGLVGSNEGTLSQCYCTGAVEGASGAGGLVGINGFMAEHWGDVTDCYSTSDVKSSGYAGGLLGGGIGAATRCYSTGVISGSYAGGLVGGDLPNRLSMTACFWDIQTSGQAKSAGGMGKTTSEMQMAGTFIEAGWDLVDETENGTEDIWWIDEGQDYPRLWWEAIGN